MGTLPPRARKRLRVIDAETTDIASIDIDQVDWDDENRLCVVETVPAPETSAERAAEIEERRRAYRNAHVALKPAALAAFEAMRDALDGHGDALGRRLTSTRSDALLMSVRMPDNLWVDAFHGALKALVTFIACTDPDVETSYAVAVPQSERWHAEYVFQADVIMRDLMKGHVFMLHPPQVYVQPSLAPLVDIALDLSTMSDRYLASAVRRAFDLDESKPWLGPPVAQIKPGLFDAACGRAADWTGVAPILNRLAKAELDDEALKAAAEKTEKDKKVSTTSTSAKAVYVPEVLHPTAPKIADLSGYGAASAWGEALAADLADYRAGRLSWADVDSGCLLHGPPGTGKTLFASALAASCGVAFIATSYAQWQSAGDGHLGYVTKAIRAVFEAANRAAPCVLFIDEIDTMGSRGKRGDGDGWWTAVQTCVLECSDGTKRREGVVLIGACNHPENLDPALVRSGRLDRHFEIGLPDEPALLGIMRHHMPDASAEDLAPAATALAGSTSGADVARIAREARRAARRQRRAVTAQDLLDVAMPPDLRPAHLRRLIAVHEAGHAVVGMLLGHVPQCLSTVRAGTSAGSVSFETAAAAGRVSDISGRVATILAGRAAEEVVLGEVSAGAGGMEGSDLHVATSLLASAEARQGLGSHIAYVGEPDAAAVEARLRRLYAETVLLIVRHRRAVEALADLAMERRVLGRAALVEFAREHRIGGSF